MQNFGSPLNLSHYFSKHEETGKQTRNPTTDKKIEDSSLEFKRTNPFHQQQYVRYPRTFDRPKRGERGHSYREEIMRLSMKKEQCVHNRRYDQAEKLDHKISGLRKNYFSQKISRLVESQKQEKRSVSEAHKNEMHYLNRAWKEYFTKLERRERNIFLSFQQQQQKQIRQARRRTRERCRSHSISREVLQLQSKEQLLMRTGDFQHLKLVKHLLTEAISKDKRRRSAMIERTSWMEEERVRASQLKKYNALIQRLEEYRRDKERIYMREQKRLRQKYKNVLQRLEHQQREEFVQLKQGIELQI